MAAGTMSIGELTEDGYFPPCPSNWTHHIPCYDPNIAVHFPFADNVFRERHCPPPSARPRCLIPPPPGYQRAPPWPDSLWSVYARSGRRGAVRGAAAQLHSVRVAPAHGSRHIGAGVGGFAVELLRQGMITVSLGPRDGFRGQAQFALERGLPALVGILATMRLPFPSLAFDLVHCSHCQVPFGLPSTCAATPALSRGLSRIPRTPSSALVLSHARNGTHLFEVDRVLRAGGFFVLAGPPVRWPGRAAEWRTLRDKARALCWRLVLVVPHVAIWRKSRGVEVAGGSGESGGERR
ncbi:unnamed protein product, partial [Closterium sp. NIES-65]